MKIKIYLLFEIKKKKSLSSSKIEVSGKLENEDVIIKNMHGSVNVGISGRKGSIKI